LTNREIILSVSASRKVSAFGVGAYPTIELKAAALLPAIGPHLNSMTKTDHLP
jgi:hypothetical protein